MVTGNMGRTQSLTEGAVLYMDHFWQRVLPASLLSITQYPEHGQECPVHWMIWCCVRPMHTTNLQLIHHMSWWTLLGKPNLKAKPPKMCYTLSLGTNHTCLNFGEQFTLGWVWLHIFGISGGHWFTWSII